MLSRPMRRFERDDRGGAMVEFTLILPFLILLFVLTVEIGHVLREHQMVSLGVRDATRFLSRVPDPNDGGARAAATAMASRTSLADTTVAVTITGGTFNNGAGTLRGPATIDLVTVSARATVSVPVVGPVLRLFGNDSAGTLSFTVVDQTRHYGG